MENHIISKGEKEHRFLKLKENKICIFNPMGGKRLPWGFPGQQTETKTAVNGGLPIMLVGIGKNKGTTVCHSNMVRVEKANTFVYHQLDKLLSDEKFFKEVVERVNREHRILKKNAIKERGVQEKNQEKIRIRQQRNHELYEDGEISREERDSKRDYSGDIKKFQQDFVQRH